MKSTRMQKRQQTRPANLDKDEAITEFTVPACRSNQMLIAHTAYSHHHTDITWAGNSIE